MREQEKNGIRLYLQNSDILLKSISSNRNFLMGVAICCVLVFHAFCWIYNPIWKFNIGYIGVDIFLFLSGFGLYRSYEQNTLSSFYKKRFFRIFPLYFIATCIVYLICFKQWSFLIFLENITTLGFYINFGVNRFDWYINALITLYIFFPFFYWYAKLKYVGLAIVSIIVIIILISFHNSIFWWYDCFISRIPIFLYGILFHRCHKSSKYIVIAGLLLYLPCRHYLSSFLASSLITLPFIILLLSIGTFCPNKLKKITNYLGQHSLELYLANLIICFFFITYKFSITEKIILYISIEIILTGIFIFIANIINKYRSI